jgi:hypothetical protein
VLVLLSIIANLGSSRLYFDRERDDDIAEHTTRKGREFRFGDDISPYEHILGSNHSTRCGSKSARTFARFGSCHVGTFASLTAGPGTWLPRFVAKFTRDEPAKEDQPDHWSPLTRSRELYVCKEGDPSENSLQHKSNTVTDHVQS